MKKLILPIIATATATVTAACSSAATDVHAPKPAPEKTFTSSPADSDTAIFAGGCFWCVESDFEKLDGVFDVVSGYTGGNLRNPTYRNHGKHVEGVEVIFDPNIVSYEELLDFYWRHIDPTDDGGQFCDRGHAYIPVIYARPDQLQEAEASKAELETSKPFTNPIVVPVLPAKTFWKAEDYHQEYYKKNPKRYELYRKGCGRDARVNQLWGGK